MSTLTGGLTVLFTTLSPILLPCLTTLPTFLPSFLVTLSIFVYISLALLETTNSHLSLGSTTKSRTIPKKSGKMGLGVDLLSSKSISKTWKHYYCDVLFLQNGFLGAKLLTKWLCSHSLYLSFHIYLLMHIFQLNHTPFSSHPPQFEEIKFCSQLLLD